MAKKKEKKAEKVAKGKLNSKEKQIKIFVVFMLFLVVFIFLVYFLWQKTKKFEYAGLEFVKEKRGSLSLYHVRFPIKNALGNVINYIPFYFREDPRKLKDIKIEGGKIVLMRDVAFVGGVGTMVCEDSILAATTLSLFLSEAGLKPFAGTTNKSSAEERNITYADCSNAKTYSLILFENGNQNIIKKSGNCYTLSFENCEIMNVSERFMLGLYAHSQKIEI